MPASDHACCLPRSAKQDGLRYVTFLFPRESESPPVGSRMTCGYRAYWVHFGLVRFFIGDSDGVTTEAGYAKRNAVMGDVPFRIDL